jgi:hypothetical protein
MVFSRSSGRVPDGSPKMETRSVVTRAGSGGETITQGCGGIRRGENANEVRNLKRVTQALERERVRSREQIP